MEGPTCISWVAAMWFWSQTDWDRPFSSPNWAGLVENYILHHFTHAQPIAIYIFRTPSP